MKRLVYILTVMMALWQTIPVLAVTDKEMEQARVIATKTYLRYANDGSGYLDKLNPSTMAELEKNLKAKEKENIKAFKAIPVPTGYASWDKQKLVDYWTNTAFAHAGLEKKGLQAGKSAARKKLNNMKVGAPQAAAQTEAASPASASAPASSAATAASETKPAEQTQFAAAQPADNKDALPAAEAALDSAQAELEEAKALAQGAIDDEDPMIQKESSHTWIYVVVLCILVAVVVALVVFASNVMKKTASNQPLDYANSDDAKALARNLKNAKNRVEELEHQNQQLNRRIDALTAEINKLRARNSQSPTQQAPIQGIPYPKTPSTSEARPRREEAVSNHPSSGAASSAPGTTSSQATDLHRTAAESSADSRQGIPGHSADARQGISGHPADSRQGVTSATTISDLHRSSAPATVGDLHRPTASLGDANRQGVQQGSAKPVASQSAPRQQGQQPASPSAPRQQGQQSASHPVRTIYLGRANAKQIFIRADRTLNPGNSVFRLDTSDGLAGTFKVVNDPSIIELVKEHPAEMLSAACVGPDLGNTEHLKTIVTDSAGTAIFEGGRWIVMRKAKIHYE